MEARSQTDEHLGVGPELMAQDVLILGQLLLYEEQFSDLYCSSMVQAREL